jgi:hypothetical protein
VDKKIIFLDELDVVQRVSKSVYRGGIVYSIRNVAVRYKAYLRTWALGSAYLAAIFVGKYEFYVSRKFL